MDNVFELTLEARRYNSEALAHVVEHFEPFIQKSLQQTSYKEREDLRQVLRLKCIESIFTFQVENVPGFWDFKNELTQ
ncbi:helix-turn-helix domain-containing protein [Alteribacillus bidgolensis]|uniref:Helix-turn-helix domain-containing protein n=1 Tax=Alteribacillus bidgolensis TaxID=930129 RepID=A0A1G8LXS3_9BACI|nr:helix-turn-helix domain-containing protein [Alteribacillus bidgolensis]SDI60514.1 Helix-turn-helix domain-containing protein [Alteribacillus bidgolensis]